MTKNYTINQRINQKIALTLAYSKGLQKARISTLNKSILIYLN